MLCYTQCRSLDDPFFLSSDNTGCAICGQYTADWSLFRPYPWTTGGKRDNGTREMAKPTTGDKILCAKPHHTVLPPLLSLSLKTTRLFCGGNTSERREEKETLRNLSRLTIAQRKLWNFPYKEEEENTIYWYLSDVWWREKKLNGWISFVVDMDQPKMGIFQAT